REAGNQGRGGKGCGTERRAGEGIRQAPEGEEGQGGGQAQEAERNRRRGQGPGRGGRSAELPGADQGDGREGLLDLTRRQDASSDSLFRNTQGDPDQGERRAVQKNR